MIKLRLLLQLIFFRVCHTHIEEKNCNRIEIPTKFLLYDQRTSKMNIYSSSVLIGDCVYFCMADIAFMC